MSPYLTKQLVKLEKWKWGSTGEVCWESGLRNAASLNVTTQADHIPNISDCDVHSEDDRDGTCTRPIRWRWLHLSHMTGWKETHEPDRPSWSLGARWLFHVPNHGYRNVEKCAVKTYRNEFFHYCCVCGRLSVQLTQSWNTTPLWRRWPEREYSSDMQFVCVSIRINSFSTVLLSQKMQNKKPQNACLFPRTRCQVNILF